MKVEIEIGYCASTKLFTINGIPADIDDFGECYDDNKEAAPEYGCGNMCFHAYDEPSLEPNVLDRYHISYSEWEKICDILTNKLQWGRCNLCE